MAEGERRLVGISEDELRQLRTVVNPLSKAAALLVVLTNRFHENGITEEEIQTVMEWAQARDLDITPPDYRVQHSAIQAKLRSAFEEAGSE